MKNYLYLPFLLISYFSYSQNSNHLPAGAITTNPIINLVNPLDTNTRKIYIDFQNGLGDFIPRTAELSNAAFINATPFVSINSIVMSDTNGLIHANAYYSLNSDESTSLVPTRLYGSNDHFIRGLTLPSVLAFLSVNSSPPAHSNSAGIKGQTIITTSNIYFCVDTNTWVYLPASVLTTTF